MLDGSALITILPPLVSAFFAYLVARKRNTISERVNKAKINADIQSQALTIVQGVMNDMKEEFKKEIEGLRKENKELRDELDDAQEQIHTLMTQVSASDQLVASLKSEIASLRSTIAIYEAEINRLRKGDSK
jgi:peptidoglycan hydrolase CwlO-like protein